ncbi:MAG TPA: hypothetical protein VJ183_13805 [Chloroflexia bacterium]|nr:hypothetical protein [Chloroflexia bacterium]
MFSAPDRDATYRKSTLKNQVVDSQAESGESSTGVHIDRLAGMMQSEVMAASRNAPLRAQAAHGMQRTHGNRSVQRTQAKSTRPKPVPVQRAEIVMDPVHEWMTGAALQEAGLVDPTSSLEVEASIFNPGGIFDTRAFDSPEVQEYGRGVRWNDDPYHMGTEKDEFDTAIWRGAWNVAEMDDYEEEAIRRSDAGERIFGPTDVNLQARTHFGDLQFMHGMASQDGEAPAETHKQMMMWAEFMSKVALGEIKGDAALGDLGRGKDLLSAEDDDPEMRKVAELYPYMQYNTINDLFGIEEGKGDARLRATGSLLHMIQDSHMGGHTERDEEGNINAFHSYARQDHHKHGAADKAGEGDSIMERVMAMQGGAEAVQHSAQVLRLLNGQDAWGLQSHTQQPTWEAIEEHLQSEVFPLAPLEKQKAAGPGTDYEMNPDEWHGPTGKDLAHGLGNTLWGGDQVLKGLRYLNPFNQFETQNATRHEFSANAWGDSNREAADRAAYEQQSRLLTTIPWQPGSWPVTDADLTEQEKIEQSDATVFATGEMANFDWMSDTPR